MTESDKLQVELQRDDIIVTRPGTSFRASYQSSPEMPQLMCCDWVGNDPRATIGLNEFLALAWGAANDKARELGRVLINRQPNADLVRRPTSVIGGKADMALTCRYVR